jgi:hypothetical protein
MSVFEDQEIKMAYQKMFSGIRGILEKGEEEGCYLPHEKKALEKWLDKINTSNFEEQKIYLEAISVIIETIMKRKAVESNVFHIIQ